MLGTCTNSYRQTHGPRKTLSEIWRDNRVLVMRIITYLGPLSGLRAGRRWRFGVCRFKSFKRLAGLAAVVDNDCSHHWVTQIGDHEERRWRWFIMYFSVGSIASMKGKRFYYKQHSQAITVSPPAVHCMRIAVQPTASRSQFLTHGLRTRT